MNCNIKLDKWISDKNSELELISVASIEDRKLYLSVCNNNIIDK